MISQNIVERRLNIVFETVLNLSLKKSIKKNGGKILTRKRNKIVPLEQDSAKRRKKYLHLKKKSALTFNSRKNLLFF